MSRTFLSVGITIVFVLGFFSPVTAVGVTSEDVTPFSADWLVRRAEAMARRPFAAPQEIPRASLQRLTYDQHRDIRFRPERSLWRDKSLPFEAQFFHPGWMFGQAVQIHDVTEGKARRLLFDPGDFDYGKNRFKTPPARDLGFAGLRLHYRLNRPDYLDELVVFLGASYFRAVGQGQQYGITARGLLIDGNHGGKEEFPFFREFWLERPSPSAVEIVVHALLDSPSLCGAYTFRIVPGPSTVMDVSATLFARKTVEKIGVAPLTSMYLFEGKDRHFDDFRPGVHDSDGLAVLTGNGERLWRPLKNPLKGQVSVFADENPRGFGLLQRNRAFTAYEDLESRYEQRPSLWVEPGESWGKGAVYLLELPSETEYNDNIVAYWVSEKPFRAGESRNIGYRLHWSAEPPGAGEDGRVARTSSGRCDVPGARQFVIDFERGRLPGLTEETPVEADVKLSQGRIRNLVVHRNHVTRGYRVFFDVIPSRHKLIEMRCFLTAGAARLTETWSYQWTP